MLISFNGVSKKFNKKEALKDLSFSVSEGEILAIVGPNGAGKTTAIRLLLGLLKSDLGKINVCGFDVDAIPDNIRSQMGVLLEHNGLYTDMSAVDNLRFFGLLGKQSVGENELNQGVHDALCFVGFSEDKNLRVSKLSKGNIRKVALARAIMFQPRIIILDEPTDGLDPLAQRETRNALLKFVKNKKVAMVITSHNMSEVAYMADKILVICSGEEIACGTPNELIESQGGVLEIDLQDNSIQMHDILDVLKIYGKTLKYEQLTPTKIHIYAKANKVCDILSQGKVDMDISEIKIRERKCSLEDAYCMLVEQQNG